MLLHRRPQVFFRVMALNGFSFNGNSSFGSSPPTSALPTPEPTYGTLADVSDDAEVCAGSHVLVSPGAARFCVVKTGFATGIRQVKT